MNQDIINSATKDLILYFQDYLEGKNRVIEYREFKENSFKPPFEIRNHLSKNLIRNLNTQELDLIKNIDLFGILHINATKEINQLELKLHISYRKITNTVMEDLLQSYKESGNHTLWFLNSIAKAKYTYKKLLNNDISSTDSLHFKSHLEEAIKTQIALNSENYQKILFFLIKELDLYSKYIIYQYDILKTFEDISKSISIVEKLIDQNLVEEYRNSWIVSRALAENPRLFQTFNDEIFLISTIPYSSSEAEKAKSDLSKVGITYSENKAIFTSDFASSISKDFNKLLESFRQDQESITDFLRTFNDFDPRQLEALGNLFELLRFFKDRGRCTFNINNRIVIYERKEIEQRLNLDSLSTIFSPELSVNPNKYFEILNSLARVKGESTELKELVNSFHGLINILVQNSIDIFDGIHTEAKIDSIFSFFYQFNQFNLYNLAFYNDLTEIFNLFDNNGIETVSLRFENFFSNYYKILNLIDNDKIKYSKLVSEHNSRLIKYINKETPLIPIKKDHLSIVNQILSWAEEDNELIEISDEIINRVLDISTNQTEIMNVLKDLHEKLLNAYSHLFFEFLNKGIKDVNLDEISKHYKTTITDRFVEYNKIMAYFYVIGFYFEVEPNLTFKSSISVESFSDYLNGY